MLTILLALCFRVIEGIQLEFAKLPLDGNAYLIDPEPHFDSRGSFCRTVCKSEFLQHGINANFVQQSVSFNHKSGTVGECIGKPPRSKKPS